jgi:serine/threonine-protein kinase
MDPARLQPGHRLDQYELLCPLAYGGMASVWLARFGRAPRRGFERLVVLKMILPQFSQDPRFQEMFLDEARIASRIEHPNVARTLEVGEHDQNMFIAMEWVDGDSLSKVIRAAEHRKSQVPAGIALRVCADAAAGLHAAHVLEEPDGSLLGVVHRDVSPQNILLSTDGATVIIDFGIAKARDRVSQDTSAGQLKGKIRYMAPEQALGRSIDHRADVWSLGTILYELFANAPAFDGPNEVATLHKLTTGVRPAPLPGHVPESIRAVIDRALAYEPDDRYDTALELSHALEACLTDIGEPTTTDMVAQYTASLLSERVAARRRAVDAALAAAHARDAERAPSLWIGTPGGAFAPVQEHTVRLPVPHPAAHPELEYASSPSNRPVSFAEVPSITSSGTIGSAAIDYPLVRTRTDSPARRRRFLAGTILAVSVAAGLVGSLLIVTTAIVRSNDPNRTAPTHTLDHASNAAAAPPPQATELTSSNGTESLLPSVPLEPAMPLAATATPAAATPSASTSSAVTRRPASPVIPVAKPKVSSPAIPAAPPSGRSPDRGF